MAEQKKRNLKPENAAEYGRISGEKRRAKKNMQEIAQMFLTMPAPITAVPEELLKLSKQIGVKITVGGAVLLAQIHKAIYSKDTKAAEFVRDTAGEKPKDNVNMNGNISYINLMKDLKETIGEEM